jgi:hypothetical protein
MTAAATNLLKPYTESIMAFPKVLVVLRNTILGWDMQAGAAAARAAAAAAHCEQAA